VTRNREWTRWLAAIGGITIAAFAVSGWVSGGFRGSNVGAGLAVSLVYTLCIGTLTSVVCSRAWPWAEGRSGPVVWTVRIGSALGAVALGTLIGLTFLWQLRLVRGRSFWWTYIYNLEFAAFISGSFGLALMVYEYWRAKYEHSELARERALKLATEARLASLESRIHPHFLFNTLNSISALIHIDPGQADEQLQRLSGLLRFALDAAETPLVALGREMKIVEDYLAIEKTRFGDRLRIAVEVAEELRELRVPPLSVQTLAENAVKHVIAPSRLGGEVRVRASVAEGRLKIEVADGGPGVPAGALPAGRGLDNLRARLQVLYGDQARLLFGEGKVSLEVPV
jgi:signal transduction histidine kinase